ncbi:unnamed protein product [Ceutorhynchus assimilis]|uniref:Uncharacterized protein n=1 Tax=Ceutorhynchus assimilis TaxID=467358 RepID=A0A9N9MRJ9_9CUCU|nr:unnamed protein product [Ceutorhynchus assimilis]
MAEDNETARDRSQKRGMSNKSLMESPLKIHDLQKEETKAPISPLRMPDLPLPPPPPMPNIMMTSRIGYRRILANRSNEYRSPILGSRSSSMDFSGRGGNFYPRQEHFDRHLDSNRSQTLNNRRPAVVRENRANTVEFMSPILARAYLYHRENGGAPQTTNNQQQQAILTDQLGLSPLPRHKNFEHLSERLADFNDYPIFPHLYSKPSPEILTKEHKSKYFSRDSVLSNELEEVRALNQELQQKYVGDNAEKNISRILGGNSETSPEYYSVFMNEHYISDIDENEEIKEFVCGYKAPERRHSDQQEKISTAFYNYPSSTLPTSYKPRSAKKCSKKSSTSASTSNISKHSEIKTLSRANSEDFISRKPILKLSANLRSSSLHSDSAPSKKSSDYYTFFPLVTSSGKKVEFSGDSTGKVIKSPKRTVVKLAKIRKSAYIHKEFVEADHDGDALAFNRLMRNLRKEISKKPVEFEGRFDERCQENSVPPTLLAVVKSLLYAAERAKEEGVVCPEILRNNIFTVAAINNNNKHQRVLFMAPPCQFSSCLTYSLMVKNNFCKQYLVRSRSVVDAVLLFLMASPSFQSTHLSRNNLLCPTASVIRRVSSPTQKSGKPFSAIAIDQAHEHHNAEIKATGGANGLYQDLNTRRRVMLSAPEISRLVTAFENLSPSSSEKHHEQYSSFQIKFLERCLAVKDAFLSVGNPFEEHSGDLFCLDTKIVMQENSVKALNSAESAGRYAYETFVQERLNLKSKAFSITTGDLSDDEAFPGDDL